MALTLPDLPYPADALEPHIDAATMGIHHDKHHATYHAKMLDALDSKPEKEFPIEQILACAGSLGAAVRNNAGGYYNHCVYWKCMSPDGGGDPVGSLREKIDSTFGSVDELRKKMNAAGMARFGSGFVWLIHNNGELKVVSTANQDNPMMTDLVDPDTAGVPILAIDVWEHAYYLKYQNRRPDYLNAFWNVADWENVQRRYDETN